MPRVGATVTNTTLDSGRSFGDQTVQPQNQTVLGLERDAAGARPRRSGRHARKRWIKSRSRVCR